MSDMSFEQVITLSDSLSPLEKVRLVQHVMSSLQNDIEPQQPRKSLYGLWENVDVSSEAIEQSRSEMTSSFPREDI